MREIPFHGRIIVSISKYTLGMAARLFPGQIHRQIFVTETELIERRVRAEHKPTSHRIGMIQIIIITR